MNGTKGDRKARNWLLVISMVLIALLVLRNFNPTDIVLILLLGLVSFVSGVGTVMTAYNEREKDGTDDR